MQGMISGGLLVLAFAAVAAAAAVLAGRLYRGSRPTWPSGHGGTQEPPDA